MALDLKLADLYVDLSVRRTQYDNQMRQVQRELKNLPTLQWGHGW